MGVWSTGAESHLKNLYFACLVLREQGLAINEIACLILLKAVGWIFIDVANPIKLKDTISTTNKSNMFGNCLMLHRR